MSENNEKLSLSVFLHTDTNLNVLCCSSLEKDMCDKKDVVKLVRDYYRHILTIAYVLVGIKTTIHNLTPSKI